DAFQHLPAGGVGEEQLLGHGRGFLVPEGPGRTAPRKRGARPGGAEGAQLSSAQVSSAHLTIFARMSVSRRILTSSPSTLLSVPEYLPKRTSSPSTTPIAARSPESSSLPGPTAITRPRWGFSLAVSGNTMPPAVFSSASICWITTRSSSGRIFDFLVLFS